jgi:hypothetical protein
VRFSAIGDVAQQSHHGLARPGPPAPGVMNVSGTGSPRPGWNTRSSHAPGVAEAAVFGATDEMPRQGVVAFVILRGSATGSVDSGSSAVRAREDLLRSGDRLHVVSDVRRQFHDQRVASRVPYVDPQSRRRRLGFQGLHFHYRCHSAGGPPGVDQSLSAEVLVTARWTSTIRRGPPPQWRAFDQFQRRRSPAPSGPVVTGSFGRRRRVP